MVEGFEPLMPKLVDGIAEGELEDLVALRSFQGMAFIPLVSGGPYLNRVPTKPSVAFGIRS